MCAGDGSPGVGKLIVVLFPRAVESLAIFGNVGSFMTIPVGEILGCSGLGVAIVACSRISDHSVTMTGAGLLGLRCMKGVRRKWCKSNAAKNGQKCACA
jgi:hypothetical protein